MRVWKMNGAGNTFGVFDARRDCFDPDAAKIREIAETMDADQILAIEQDADTDAFMRIWNSDGAEVAACGNGARAVSHILLGERDAPRISLRTQADILQAWREGGTVTVDMGSPLTAWEDIPLAERMDVEGIDLKIGPIDKPYLSRPAVVSMGNPHAIFFVDDVSGYDIEAIGPLVEWHPVFPQGTNTGFAQILSRQAMRLRVWERGAGLTKACGTNACAALVCAVRAGLTEREADIVMDGGTLRARWDKATDHVFLSGPVEIEFDEVVRC